MLWKVDRSNGKPQMVRVDPSELEYDPACRRVLLFPGTGIHDYLAGSDAGRAQLGGSIKYIEQTLASTIDEGSPPVDIFLWTYEEPYHRDNLAPHYAIARETMARYAPSHFGRQASTYGLLPLVLKKGERIETLEPAELKRRLADITMFGHSFGSVMMQDVVDSLVYRLRNNGWEDALISPCLRELVGISVGGTARQDYPEPTMTLYAFTSVNDMTAVDAIRNENPQREDYIPLLERCGYGPIAEVLKRHPADIPRDQILEELENDIDQKRHARGGAAGGSRAIIRSIANGYSIRAMLPYHEVRWLEKQSSGAVACRVLDAKEVERTQTAVVHDFRTYLHGDHPLGDVLINVANNAVQREPGLGDGHRLLLSTEATKRQHERKYYSSRAAQVSERGLVEVSLLGK